MQKQKTESKALRDLLTTDEAVRWLADHGLPDTTAGMLSARSRSAFFSPSVSTTVAAPAPTPAYGRLDKIRAFLQFATAFKRRRQSDVAYFNPRFLGGWRWILDRRAGPARQYADDLTVR